MVKQLRPFPGLASHLPRRDVKVSVAGLAGGMVGGEAPTVALQLVGDIHVPSDGVVVAAAGRIVIDVANGDTDVSLPVYDGTVGGAWGILVTKSWAPYSYLTRVPPGVGPISLAELPALSTLESVDDVASGGGGTTYRAVVLPSDGKPGNVLGLDAAGGVQWQDVSASLMQRSTKWQFAGSDFVDISPTAFAATKYHAFPSACVLDDGNILVSVSSYQDHFGGKAGDESVFAVFDTSGARVTDWKAVPQNQAGKTSVADLCNGGDGYVYGCLMTTNPYSMIVAKAPATREGVGQLANIDAQTTLPKETWDSAWSAGPFPCATFATPANPDKGHAARVWMAGYWNNTVHFKYTEDQGGTWQDGPTRQFAGTNEVGFSVQGDYVLALCRDVDETSGGAIWQATSNDGGRSWSTLTKIAEGRSGLPRHAVMHDGSMLLGLRDMRNGEGWVFAQKAPELNGATSWWEMARAPLLGRMMYGVFMPIRRQGKNAGLWIGAAMSNNRSGVSRLYMRHLEQVPAQYYDVESLPEAVSQVVDSWNTYTPRICKVDGSPLSVGVTLVGAYRQIGRQREVWVYCPGGASNSSGDRITLELPPDFAPTQSSALTVSIGAEKFGGGRFLGGNLLQLIRWDGANATTADLNNAGGFSVRVTWEQVGPQGSNIGGFIGR